MSPARTLNLPETLTRRQREVAEAIVDMTLAQGYPPTLRELAQALEIQVNAVAGHVRLLRAKGAVSFERNLRRTLRVIEQA